MPRNGLVVLALALASTSSGCAAVSLFSHTHEHTHHHHYDTHSGEMLSRLESLEGRLGNLEGADHPASAPAPLYMPMQ